MSDESQRRAQPIAWVRHIPKERADQRLARAYKRVGGEYVANILGVQSMHPEAMEAHLALYRKLMCGASPLDRMEREAIATVAAR